MASVDISIRGAGIFGLSVAWAAVKAGARVEIVDPNGVGFGSSGGIVGALAPHVPENWNPKKQFQLESLLMAERFWADVCDIGGIDAGYCPTGRLQPLDESAVALAKSRALNAETLWQGQASWDIVSSTDTWALPSASGLYIKDTLSAHIHPRRACRALAHALVSRGATILERPQASANAVLWTTGVSGLEALSQTNTRQVGQGIKGQAALFQLDRSGLPQLFVDTLHIIPHRDGTVAVGSTTEREFSAPFETDTQLDDIIAKARKAVPELADAPVIERWAGLRPRSRSRAPMLGAWPGKPDQFIANGGFKIGFGMAPKVGQVMANLILNNKNEIPVGFDVTDSL